MALAPDAAERLCLTLVLGGARSGKSRHAQSLAMSMPPPWIYIATAEARDAEMRQRIAHHQASRGEGWSTVEASLELGAALAGVPDAAPAVIDCLTLWLSNLMLGNHEIEPAVAELFEAIGNRSGTTIIVSNEVGLGIVPETPLGRAFRDRAGLLNQQVAAKSERVVFMVAGLPMMLKTPA